MGWKAFFRFVSLNCVHKQLWCGPIHCICQAQLSQFSLHFPLIVQFLFLLLMSWPVDFRQKTTNYFPLFSDNIPQESKFASKWTCTSGLILSDIWSLSCLYHLIFPSVLNLPAGFTACKQLLTQILIGQPLWGSLAAEPACKRECDLKAANAHIKFGDI